MLKIQDLRELIKLIDQSSLQEFELESEGTKLTIRKNGLTLQQQGSGDVTASVFQSPPTSVESVSVPHAESLSSSSAPQLAVTTPADSTADATADDLLHKIVSPMVGTFYSKPDPSADPFVQTGDTVRSDSIVCIVEAMKLFNEIEAEVSGEIVKMLVTDGQLVEYGQPLFLVKKE
ncbi:acetyl-CoA carboxylase, biotin carboxyl carrier protein [Ammoniphilus oxalaticus]|uniref:Biotin carboxyl carrier protein of acetyl-CoA carboxylase n=1 Tax=Ammoniphilus oxalaticus TaxID=66863 RepID=A0A419SMR0_9BACL|nr:acetyl-CoA carboxylase biotin carboxyl carrier protein [Ammoniphilus oxalaticus]RKD25577.1 acetyl-CoA carboxylase, biotin carboxyl carrier protein [Ammoniphilus oxalaticus]